jgi:hypothetical protein
VLYNFDFELYLSSFLFPFCLNINGQARSPGRPAPKVPVMNPSSRQAPPTQRLWFSFILFPFIFFNQLHSAFRAITWLITLHFRVHWAGVLLVFLIVFVCHKINFQRLLLRNPYFTILKSNRHFFNSLNLAFICAISAFWLELICSHSFFISGSVMLASSHIRIAPA